MISDKSSTKILKDTILLQAQEEEFLTLPPGNHVFPFEFQLKGDMAETVSSYYVVVKYSLIAVLKRHGWGSNLRASKDILVNRVYFQNEIDQLANVMLCNKWPPFMEYQMMIDTKVIPLGQTVPVKFSWWPLVDRIQIRTVEFAVIEKVIHTNGELDRWLPIKSNLLLNPPIGANKLACILIPSHSNIHPDMSNQYITIQHRLEMNIHFEVNQKLNSIVLRCSIIVAPKNEEIQEDLPSYSQALLAPRVL
ncbi:hypothetical protein K7432_003678 [Basidiobolus ranarum]|uniref:Arrestin C-terminal-like domain-containing protein n=1 Tax=Basidiobolus ranarum TaxID=34480 RepID=A0ABR2WZD3_9FUNG